jgi:beta-lactam-binding protein with PASTA domain
MAEPPRPPRDPADDETVVVPADEATVVADEWGPEDDVFVEETEEVAPPPRRPPLIWPWLLALLVLVLAGLGVYWYFTQQDETTVPAVIGMRQERAEATVRDAGLDPVVTRQESARPRGIVLAQNPDPGAKVDEGSDVRLVVSNGPARETVPDVVGETESEAVADLTAAGFKAKVTRVFSDKKAGIVVSQQPQGGAKLKEGSTVAVAVSKGNKPVAVPDVVGTTSSEATATLRDAGLQADIVAVPSKEPSGTVVAQNPPAGKQVKPGTKVRLNVAQAAGTTTTQPSATTAPAPGATTPPPATTAAPASATVPDVVGKELAEAAQAFAQEGLKIAVQYVPSDEPQGRVIAQAQPAGTERKRGDTVQVNVSPGPQPAAETQVPDVVGQRLQQARRALEQAGFEVLALNLNGEVKNESPVASQTPAGGANIPRGSLVILYVGSA